MFERLRRTMDSWSWASWRVKNAESIRRRIEKVDGLEKDYERYFPLYHLGLAAALFKIGESFDVASIFHSSSALEIGLIVKLNALPSVEGRKISRKNFSSLIEDARDGGLLDQEHYERANDIRLIRNCYVHSGNIMEYVSRANDYYKNRDRVLAKYESEAERKIAEIILNSYPADPLPVPHMEWSADIKTVEFLEKRHFDFGKELVKILARYLGSIDPKKVEREAARFEGLAFTTADASYCLNNTAEILTQTGILPGDIAH